MDTNRFKTPDYKRQVRAISEHRRPIKKLPESGWDRFLFAIGLSSWPRRIAVLFAFALAIYLIYFAPFLRVTKLEVQGADAAASSGITARFQEFLRQYAYGFPERNILFFSGARFQRKLAGDFDVSAVKSISRKPLHSVVVEVVQRAPLFNLQTAGQFYVLNSDGIIGNKLDAPNPQLLTVIDTATDEIKSGQALFNPQKAAFISFMNSDFTSQTQAEIDHFEIPGTASTDLIILTKAGAKALFDNTTDPGTSLQRFFTIWAQLSPDQRNNVAYLDLRFDPKAFLCYKTDPCAKGDSVDQPAPPQPGDLGNDAPLQLK